jgi:hypothetical protein
MNTHAEIVSSEKGEGGYKNEIFHGYSTMWHDRRVYAMTVMMRKRPWHAKFAALLLLFILDAETRQSMDAWREHKARSLG